MFERFGRPLALLICGIGLAGTLPPGRIAGQEPASEVDAVDEVAAVDASLPTDSTLSAGVRATARVIRWSLPGYSQIDLNFQRTAAATEETYVVRFATDTIGMTPVDRASQYEVRITMPEGVRQRSQVVEVPIFGVPDKVRWSLRRVGELTPRGYEDVIATPYARFGTKAERLWILQESSLRWSKFAETLPANRSRDVWKLGDVVEVSEAAVSAVAADDERWDQLRRFLMAGGLVVTSDLQTVEPLTDRLNVEPFTVREDLNFGTLAFGSGVPLSSSAYAERMTGSNYWQVSVGAGKILKVPRGSLRSEMRRENVRNFAPEHCVATLARGVEPMLGDGRFRDWTVPGVAQPPVYTFMGLLAGFVVLVGPVAYRRTTRAGRGYLMFLIAPVLAGVTTTAMFAYGVVADGFGTKARVRQITFVDGRSGDATERTRATYFAGIRPRGGLLFAEDRKVFPYPQGGQRVWQWNVDEVPEQVDSIEANGSGLRFGPSFLPSRRQRQFVEFAHRETIGKLRIAEAALTDPPEEANASEKANASEEADASEKAGATDQSPRPTLQPPRVTNEFPFDLRRLIVRDSRGDYWTLPQLDAGKTATLQTIPANQRISSMIGGMYNDYRPLSEIRIARGGSTNNRQLRDLVAVLNKEVNTRQVVYEGALETLLADMMKNDNELPPGCFVAWSEVSEDVVAVEGAELIESIRFVFGTTSH